MMAASTAGQFQLRNQATGKLRIISFTMTPSDGQKVTFAGSGTTFFLTNPEGEDIVDIYVNNDGVTTVTTFKILMNGVALDIHGLLSLFAADSNITQRLVVPIGLSGSKQIQMSVHA